MANANQLFHEPHEDTSDLKLVVCQTH